jgi:hypothetical protein
VIRLVLAGVVRSQRVVTPLILTAGLAFIICSNGPQRAGETLGGIALLAIVIHAWIAYSTACSIDEPTEEALTVVAGRPRLLVAKVVTAALLAGVVEVVLLAAALVSNVMERRPTASEWWAFLIVAAAIVVLGVAIGLAAGPTVVRERGAQIVVLLALLVGSALALPIVRITKEMSRGPVQHVRLGTIAGLAVWSLAGAVVVAAASIAVARRA